MANAPLLPSWGVVILFLTVLISSWLYYNKTKPGLESIPGPTLAAYTRLWRFFDVFAGQTHITAMRLHHKHGKLVRIAPNVISVGDASMIPVIYNTKGDWTKSAFYPIFSIVWQKKARPNLFSITDQAEHREQKRKVASAFTLDNLLKMESTVDDCSRLFLSRMGEFADAQKPVDLGSWLTYYTFDAIGELTFNKRFGFLEKGGDIDGIIHVLERVRTYGTLTGQIPESHGFLLGNPLIPIILPRLERMNEVLNFTLKAIDMRASLTRDGELHMEEDRVGNDMLSRWAAVNASNPLKMSTKDVIVHTSGNVLAGSDTTVIALRAILYLLIKNPAKMQKAVQEIDAADRRGKLSRFVQDKEARNELPFLNAVIKEALRMHPSVGVLLERHVPAGGVVICDHLMPAGTIVGINAWVVHYDPEVFTNPEDFEPERWLETGSNKEQLAVMERSFFTFGGGTRTCIGKNIGFLEMRKIVPQLLREFEITIPGDKVWKCKNDFFVHQEIPPCMLKRRVKA